MPKKNPERPKIQSARSIMSSLNKIIEPKPPPPRYCSTGLRPSSAAVNERERTTSPKHRLAQPKRVVVMEDGLPQQRGQVGNDFSPVYQLKMATLDQGSQDATEDESQDGNVDMESAAGTHSRRLFTGDASIFRGGSESKRKMSEVSGTGSSTSMQGLSTTLRALVTEKNNNAHQNAVASATIEQNAVDRAKLAIFEAHMHNATAAKKETEAGGTLSLRSMPYFPGEMDEPPLRRKAKHISGISKKRHFPKDNGTPNGSINERTQGSAEQQKYATTSSFPRSAISGYFATGEISTDRKAFRATSPSDSTENEHRSGVVGGVGMLGLAQPERSTFLRMVEENQVLDRHTWTVDVGLHDRSEQVVETALRELEKVHNEVVGWLDTILSERDARVQSMKDATEAKYEKKQKQLRKAKIRRAAKKASLFSGVAGTSDLTPLMTPSVTPGAEYLDRLDPNLVADGHDAELVPMQDGEDLTNTRRGSGSFLLRQQSGGFAVDDTSDADPHPQLVVAPRRHSILKQDQDGSPLSHHDTSRPRGSVYFTNIPGEEEGSPHVRRQSERKSSVFLLESDHNDAPTPNDPPPQLTLERTASFGSSTAGPISATSRQSMPRMDSFVVSQDTAPSTSSAFDAVGADLSPTQFLVRPNSVHCAVAHVLKHRARDGLPPETLGDYFNLKDELQIVREGIDLLPKQLPVQSIGFSYARVSQDTIIKLGQCFHSLHNTLDRVLTTVYDEGMSRYNRAEQLRERLVKQHVLYSFYVEKPKCGDHSDVSGVTTPSTTDGAKDGLVAEQLAAQNWNAATAWIPRKKKPAEEERSFFTVIDHDDELTARDDEAMQGWYELLQDFVRQAQSIMWQLQLCFDHCIFDSEGAVAQLSFASLQQCLTPAFPGSDMFTGPQLQSPSEAAFFSTSQLLPTRQLIELTQLRMVHCVNASPAGMERLMLSRHYARSLTHLSLHGVHLSDIVLFALLDNIVAPQSGPGFSAAASRKRLSSVSGKQGNVLAEASAARRRSSIESSDFHFLSNTGSSFATRHSTNAPGVSTLLHLDIGQCGLKHKEHMGPLCLALASPSCKLTYLNVDGMPMPPGSGGLFLAAVKQCTTLRNVSMKFGDRVTQSFCVKVNALMTERRAQDAASFTE